MKIFLGQVLLVETVSTIGRGGAFFLTNRIGVPVVLTDFGPIGRCLVDARSISDFIFTFNRFYRSKFITKSPPFRVWAWINRRYVLNIHRLWLSHSRTNMYCCSRALWRRTSYYARSWRSLLGECSLILIFDYMCNRIHLSFYNTLWKNVRLTLAIL